MLHHRNVRVLSEGAYSSLINLLFDADDAQREMMLAIGVDENDPPLSSFITSLNAAPSFEALSHASHPGVYVLAPFAISQSSDCLHAALDDICPRPAPFSSSARSLIDSHVLTDALNLHCSTLQEASCAHAAALAEAGDLIARTVRSAAHPQHPPAPLRQPPPGREPQSSLVKPPPRRTSRSVSSSIAETAAAPPGASVPAGSGSHPSHQHDQQIVNLKKLVRRLERRCRALESMASVRQSGKGALGAGTGGGRGGCDGVIRPRLPVTQPHPPSSHRLPQGTALKTQGGGGGGRPPSSKKVEEIGVGVCDRYFPHHCRDVLTSGRRDGVCDGCGGCALCEEQDEASRTGKDGKGLRAALEKVLARHMMACHKSEAALGGGGGEVRAVEGGAGGGEVEDAGWVDQRSSSSPERVGGVSVSRSVEGGQGGGGSRGSNGGGGGDETSDSANGLAHVDQRDVDCPTYASDVDHSDGGGWGGEPDDGSDGSSEGATTPTDVDAATPLGDERHGGRLGLSSSRRPSPALLAQTRAAMAAAAAAAQHPVNWTTHNSPSPPSNRPSPRYGTDRGDRHHRYAALPPQHRPDVTVSAARATAAAAAAAGVSGGGARGPDYGAGSTGWPHRPEGGCSDPSHTYGIPPGATARMLQRMTPREACLKADILGAATAAAEAAHAADMALLAPPCVTATLAARATSWPAVGGEVIGGGHGGREDAAPTPVSYAYGARGSTTREGESVRHRPPATTPPPPFEAHSAPFGSSGGATDSGGLGGAKPGAPAAVARVPPLALGPRHRIRSRSPPPQARPYPYTTTHAAAGAAASSSSSPSPYRSRSADAAPPHTAHAYPPPARPTRPPSPAPAASPPSTVGGGALGHSGPFTASSVTSTARAIARASAVLDPPAFTPRDGK